MRIKFQSGGMITYTPVFPESLDAESTKSEKTKTDKQEKISGTLQEEIINVLKENGIKSDVDSFLTTANDFLAKSKALSTVTLFGGEDDYTMSDLITVMKLANSVKQNKEQWTSAVQRLNNQDAWDEVATTTTGRIYVYDEKNTMTTVTPDEYYKNKEKYHGRALTNSQVLGLRENNKALAFDSNILKDINGVLGFDTITKHLIDTITKFDTMSKQEYIKKTGESISQSTWEGFQNLITNGPDGYYKATTKSEIKDIENAVKYLWDSLGIDGQKRLRAEVAVSGADPSKNYLDLIMQAIEVHTSNETTVDFDKSASEYDSDGDGKGGKTEPLSRLAAFAAGKGESSEIFIVPRASQVGQRGTMTVKAMNFGNMIGFDQNTLPAMSVGSLRSHAEYFKAAWNQDVTFGGQLLKGNEEQAVLWDGISQVSQVWLPYKHVNGQITPDFDLLLRYMDFVDELDNNPNMSNTEITKLLDKYRLNGHLQEGTIQLKDTMCFMTFSGYAHEDNIEMTEATERMTEKVPKGEGKQIAQIYENASKYGKTTPGKNDKEIYGFDSMNVWDYGEFRKGNVFIPIKSSFLGTYASMEEIIPESMVNNFHHRSTLSNGKPGISGQFK